MACATDVARQFLPCVQPVPPAMGGEAARSINLSCNGHSPPQPQYSAEKNDDQDTTVATRVLVIGATGFIGRFVAEASVKSGRPTYALVRPTTLSSKPKVIQSLVDSGVQVVYGCLHDHNSLVKAMRQVDVVICTVGGDRILDQLKIVDAIKEVGTVKRFLPSEFGHDVDRADPVEPALSFYIDKRKVRRAVEEAKIPYTYICCNSIAGWPYYYHTHPTELPPPKERFEIYGDGSVKANFMPSSIVAALTHDIFINGCQFKFPIQEPHHVEACELYPDMKYTTIDDFFESYL